MRSSRLLFLALALCALGTTVLADGLGSGETAPPPPPPESTEGSGETAPPPPPPETTEGSGETTPPPPPPETTSESTSEGSEGGSSGGSVPLIGEGDSDAIPGQYIVLFKDSAGQSAKNLVLDYLGNKVSYVYTKAFDGFALKNLDNQTLADIRTNTALELIEVDRTVSTATGTEAGVSAKLHAAAMLRTHLMEQVAAGEDPTIHITDTQDNPEWALDRIDQRDLPLNNKYKYVNDGGKVNVYVLDTGIRTTHSEFQGRATQAYSVVTDEGANNNVDCNGHGTQVAAMIAGQTYGMAKKAEVHGIKVLGCDGQGSTSDMIAGIDWVLNNKDPAKPAIMQLSLVGELSMCGNLACSNAVDQGVLTVAAAGNSNSDACEATPASANTLLTVAASDSSDAKWANSNHGHCVDLFAPGVSVKSATNTSDSATATVSGTSYSAAMVSGLASVYLTAYPTHTPAITKNAILQAATPGKITGLTNATDNLLAFSFFFQGEIDVLNKEEVETIVREVLNSTQYQGPVGPAGPKGDKGDQGLQGVQGPVGPTGATGAQGPTGSTGATGATGPQGIQGIEGPQGVTGAQGPQGSIGPQGIKGDTGATGATSRFHRSPGSKA
eukprot:TRINITY_DN233_c0_g1_i4.p1 TRINITY_DN233_c0_g1~~TRINITY_DN233_c0_g1_i4.p1  ORF type:complete len:611 (-),score=186.26 TRINITY_DN233_c0_g1_i4:203-2035(-)